MKSDEERKRWFLWIKKTTLKVKDGLQEPPYLIRYSLFSCPWFAIKLHRILLSDDDCMHDHPWSFISIILSGGYFEHTPNPMAIPCPGSALYPNYPSKLKWYGPGRILWRPAPSIHRLQVLKPATTLVISFKKKRQWGFWTPSGWKVWYEFIRQGRRCE